MPIKDIGKREPIGAVVSIGVKHKERGFPTETDRFHIVNPREESGIRHLHPAFTSFNQAPVDKRKIIKCNIVHATREECFEYNLKAQVLTKAHPDKRPACVGDGVHARRWEGPEPDNFMEIKCLHEKCEYRLTTPPKCKPFSRLLFRLRWNDGIALPTPLVKYTTGAWNTTANLVGFFDYIDSFARQMGLTNYSLFGFPFVMTLQYQTKPSAKSRFPVVHISPEQDPLEFFSRQQNDIIKLQESKSFEALPDNSQQDNNLVLEDIKSVSVPNTGSNK